MGSLFSKELLGHPLVLGAIGAAVLIALGSGAYYSAATRTPAVTQYAQLAPATTTITATGTVVPAQNPDLEFQTAGRVAAVHATVGEAVSAGEMLASLDTAALSAAREQAAANVRAAQAKLDALKAGPRDVDVSAKQTAVAQAEQSLSNTYAQVPADLGTAYSGSLGAVQADTDSLFTNPEGNPMLVFSTNNNQLAIDAAAKRQEVNASLATWKAELAGGATDQATLDAELGDSLTQLADLRAYADTLTEALGSVVPTSDFPASSVTTGNTNLAALRGSLAASLAALTADTQSIASQKLAIKSAEDALAQTTAPATSQDIEAQSAAVDAAQASLDAAQAALDNAIITAPFSGTVAAVRIKVGDQVGTTLPAISLTPQSGLEVEAYLSEADAGAVVPGDAAAVTLDAYGSGRVFPATVSSVDRAPTMQNGIPAYKATLQFAQNDQALAAGMTANVTLTPTR